MKLQSLTPPEGGFAAAVASDFFLPFLVLCAMEVFAPWLFFQEMQPGLIWLRAPFAAKDHPSISSSSGRFSQREHLGLASTVIATFSLSI